jgi:hypothetical protein
VDGADVDVDEAVVYEGVGLEGTVALLTPFWPFAVAGKGTHFMGP